MFSRRYRLLGSAFLVAAMVASLLGTLQAQQPRSVAQGVYTGPQAVRGQAVYAENCASCHGPTLGGAQAPPLTGDDFMRVWGGPASDLVNKIQNTMPANDPGKLTRQQAADIVAHMLQVAKFPAGADRARRRRGRAESDRDPGAAGSGQAAGLDRFVGTVVPAGGQHGAVDARHAVSDLEPDLQRPETRSRGGRGRRTNRLRAVSPGPIGAPAFIRVGRWSTTPPSRLRSRRR